MDLDSIVRNAELILAGVGGFTMIYTVARGIKAGTKYVRRANMDKVGMYSLQSVIGGDGFPEKAISEAVESGEFATISGTVTEYYGIPSGYSGIIEGDCKIPFYLHSTQGIKNQALIPILFNASTEMGAIIRMSGCFDKDSNMFISTGLEATMNSVEYRI